jgi:hypothetical protein
MDLSTHYAIATTYRLSAGWPNKLAVECKRCGEKLARGEGTLVTVASINGPHPTSPFFCSACVDWVKRSGEAVLDRQLHDAKAPR